MTLGARLKALRLRNGESLQQVADAVGASKPHIWELETGRSKNPSVDLLAKLAAHFETTVSHLIGEEAADPDVNALVFGREFKDLKPEDWDVLRTMAKRLKGS